MWWVVGGYLAAIALSAVLHFIAESLFAKEPQYKGRHVLISGASEGLGLCIARRLIEKGAHVTLFSRTVSKLKKAVDELETYRTSEGQVIKYISGDVSNPEDCARAVAGGPVLPPEDETDDDVAMGGPPSESNMDVDFLVCCAGAAAPGYFVEQDISSFQWMMDVNYFGVVNLVKAVTPSMAARRSGHVVIVCSAMSFMSFVGYSQYAASKWAARALADGLRNELLRHNIKVTAFYPSTIDSPGLVRENKTKPPECMTIEGEDSAFCPLKTADCLFHGMKVGQYAITQEFLIWLARSGMNGITPRHYFLTEWLLQPIVFPVFAGYRVYMDFVAARGPGRSSSEEPEEKVKHS